MNKGYKLNQKLRLEGGGEGALFKVKDVGLVLTVVLFFSEKVGFTVEVC